MLKDALHGVLTLRAHVDALVAACAMAEHHSQRKKHVSRLVSGNMLHRIGSATGITVLSGVHSAFRDACKASNFHLPFNPQTASARALTDGRGQTNFGAGL